MRFASGTSACTGRDERTRLTYEQNLCAGQELIPTLQLNLHNPRNSSFQQQGGQRSANEFLTGRERERIRDATTDPEDCRNSASPSTNLHIANRGRQGQAVPVVSANGSGDYESRGRCLVSTNTSVLAARAPMGTVNDGGRHSTGLHEGNREFLDNDSLEENMDPTNMHLFDNGNGQYPSEEEDNEI